MDAESVSGEPTLNPPQQNEQETSTAQYHSQVSASNYRIWRQ
jgi:hypothetical protein